MTDRDKNMYALGMLQMAKIVIAATREINIVGSYSVMYAMGVRDTDEKDAPLSMQQFIMSKIFSKRNGFEWLQKIQARFIPTIQGDEI